MINYVTTWSIGPGVTEREFDAWYPEHKDLVSKMPGLRRFINYKVVPSEHGDAGFMYLAEMFYDNMDIYAKSRQSDEAKRARAHSAPRPEFIVKPHRFCMEVTEDLKLL